MGKVTFKRRKTYQQSILIENLFHKTTLASPVQLSCPPNGRPVVFAWQFLVRYKRLKVLNNTNCNTSTNNNDDDDDGDDDDNNKK